MRVGIVTVSDRSFLGEREDLSGPKLKNALLDNCRQVEVITRIVPDDRAQLQRVLISLADDEGCSVILTTGGTGCSPRDVTPETTMSVIEREVPGLAEAMRNRSIEKTPMAMLSRAVCGIRGNTLIINLPGSPRGSCECLQVILPTLPHAVELLSGEPLDCGRPSDDP